MTVLARIKRAVLADIGQIRPVNKMRIIKICPTCARSHVRRVKRDVECNFRGLVFKARAIEFHECPDCGEKLYDREAMRKMESFRPKTRRKTRVA
jgi:ribosomal protein L37AE/L43A